MKKSETSCWLLLICLTVMACTHPKTSQKQIQNQADSILMSKARDIKADSALLAIMEVETGEMVVLSCVYRIDSALKKSDNRLFLQPQEPGTLFTPVAILAALEKGASMEDTIDLENGEWRIFDHLVLRDPDNASVPAKTTLHDALLRNSSIAVAKTIHHHFGSHTEQFREALMPMLVLQPGSSEPINFAFPEERTNIMASIGYGFRLSPLQILAFYNALANGGQLVMPQAEDKGKVLTIYPTIGSPINLEKLTYWMEEAAPSPLLAGKPGLAQLMPHQQGYCYSFCGYFPKENPRYSILSIFYQTHPAKDTPFDVCRNMASSFVAK